MQQQKQIKYIALLQVMAIILVVLYHSFHQHPGGNFGFDLWGMRLLATMRMPIFLFISGFLMVVTTNRKKPSWKTYSVGKIKRLLVPFVVLTLVTFVPRAMLSDIADEPIGLTVQGLADSLVRSDSMVIPFFWYLQASIILLCLTYGATLLARRAGLQPAALYLALFVVFYVIKCLGTVHTDLFSAARIAKWGVNFYLGALYACLPSRLDSMIPWTNPVFTVVSAVVWISLFALFEYDQWLSQLITVAAFVTFVSLARIFEKRNITVLDHLIGANYIIFLLSWYFNILAQQVLHHVVPTLPWQVHTVLSLILGVYCPLLLLNILRHNPEGRFSKAVAFLLGQKL